MEPEGSLHYPQALAICPFPQLEQSSSFLPIQLLEDTFQSRTMEEKL
jgi:hypothetical protein